MVFSVGDTKDSIQITKPSDGGNYNRDVELAFPGLPTGKIRFEMKNTSGSFYIHTITVKASNGSPNIPGLTADIFQIVTDVNDLTDGDDVIFGVSGTQYNYLMGLYDEYNSRNNIYAIRGVYSTDRQSVNENAAAVYTLLKGELDGGGSYYAFADVDGYFLVASGGNPNNGNNNYLTVWDTVYSNNYGLYGVWTVSIADDGAASVVNLGRSRSGKLQFNPNSGTPVFACYADWTQTKPVLYKRITIDDPAAPYIKAPLCNFGTVLLKENSISGNKTLEINAINLTEDISVTLLHGGVFSVNKTSLDRDGDKLQVSYTASSTGSYRDTLILQSGTAEARINLLLNVDRELTVSQACLLSDLTQCWLNPVVITKKYDRYVFVRDETGSMLLYAGAENYAQDRKNGDILTGVTGQFKNYYGNPEINLNAQFSYTQGDAALPEHLTDKPDSVDVCRYIHLSNVRFQDNNTIIINGQELPVYNLFNNSQLSVVNTTQNYEVEGIVYYYNQVVLCPTDITLSAATATGNISDETTTAVKLIRDGEVLIRRTDEYFDLRGGKR